MNARIRNIIFDFGNVIVDLDRKEVERRFARQGLDVARFLGLSRQKGIFEDLELGRCSANEWVAQLMEQADDFRLEGHEVCLTPEGIKDAWNSMLAGIPLRRLQALDVLRRHYRIAMLSNTNEVHIDYSFEAHFRAQGYEPKELFEHIFLSNEMQLAKPGRAIYERVLREGGYKPEETLFVDDCQENCDAFAELGVQTFCPKHPDEWLGLLCPAVATIGFFDGVHRGHQYLISSLKEREALLPALPQKGEGLATLEGWHEGERPFADVRNGEKRDLSQTCEMERKEGWRDEERKEVFRRLIVTFAEHPRSVLQSDYVPELLTSPQEKVELLKETGVDGIEMLHFTKEMSRLTAKEFMEQILRDKLGVRVLVMGYDHRFGHGGGTLEDYQRWGREVGIEVVKALPLQEEKVSSSMIRSVLKEGKVGEAFRLLGHAYTLQGEVVKGFHVGHELGFPTANLKPYTHKLVPARGVYAVYADLDDDKRYAGMLNIGERPTIGNSTEESIEVNLLDFEGDLYGRQLTVQFVAFLRPERKFENREALVEQIRLDEEETRRELASEKLTSHNFL